MSEDGDATTVPALAATLPERTSRPALEQFREGSTVGRYRLKQRLGAGAMGVVWSARDPQLDRDVAIKLVHPELARSNHAATRFKREARAMAKLSHRSVITVHDAGDVDGMLFLAMELVRGTTLGQLLRQRDAAAIADWRRWLAMLIDAGRGLAEAHKNGVLHRDFKPDNVLVDDSGRVCVGDFGLATLGERPHRAETAPPTAEPATSGFDLTTTGAILGTPLYMSPQQLNGEPIDARADQFAFCVALHEAMYGVRPFSTTDEGLAAIPSLAEQIALGLPAPAEDSPVPRGIHECIRRGLAAEPDARWPDMDALLAELDRSGRPNDAVKATAPRRWPLVAAAAAVLVFGVVLVVVLTRRSPDPVLHRMFGTPLNTRTAISPSGNRFALGGEVLEVRNADGSFSKSVALPPGIYGVLYLELDDHEVRFSLDTGHQRFRWRYRESATAVVDIEDVGGQWRGTTVAGELLRLSDRGLGIIDRDRKLDRWPVRDITIAAISPDGRRVAYVEGGRFAGSLVVRDVKTKELVRSEPIEEVTSLVWFDSTTLIYATSTLVKPQIWRVKVDPSFGKHEVIYGVETGWFADLAVGGGRLYVVTMPPSPRGRVIERGASTKHSELDSVSLPMAWSAQDKMVTWNTANRQSNIRDLATDLSVRPAPGADAAVLDSEPINATMVGDVLIATLRARGGRNVVAVSLTDGKELWRSPDKRTFGVRCAGDRALPCFAIRIVRDDLEQIVGIDPRTGTLSAPIYEARRIEDIAVSSDGTRLLVPMNDTVIELDSSGKEIETYLLRKHVMGKASVNFIRTVAYDPLGGFLLGGTIARNLYQVGQLKDGRYDQLHDASDKILWLVRPSPDGSRVALIARGYEPELFRLDF